MPVITTQNGGQASYVRDGEDGYFVDCGNVSDLTARLILLIQNFTKTKKLGEKGRNGFRDLFLAKDTSEFFLKLYKRN
jgi:glycosyltransferase involved in cell wall biosynthesis